MDRHRKNKSDKTAERILAAARTVFAQKGYNGAHVDEIAARAGVNKATIYYQIGNKHSLYADVIHRVIAHVTRGIADAVSRETYPEEKLKAYITFIAGAVEANPDLPPIMMRESAAGGYRGYCFDPGHTVRHSGSRKRTGTIYRNITFSDSHDDYGNDSFF